MIMGTLLEQKLLLKFQQLHKMKVIIIEDEMQSAQLLTNMLNEIDNSIEILEICKKLPEAIISIKKNKPAFVFLDIELPNYSGLQILDFFDPSEINFKIIFVTAYNKYAIEAFKLSAIDYLLKPVEIEKLKDVVIKMRKAENLDTIYASNSFSLLKNNLHSNKQKKIALPIQSGYEIIPIDQITFIKAEGSYARVETLQLGSFLISKNLKYFEDMLNHFDHFMRVHRSYLVNLNFASKILKSNSVIVLENDIEVPIINEKIDDIIKSLHR